MTVGSTSLLKFLIKSPAGILFERDNIRAIRIDLVDGKIGIRPGHAPLVAEAADGEAEIESEFASLRIPIKAGILVVRDNQISLLTHALDDQKDGKNKGSYPVLQMEDDEEFDKLLESILSTLRMSSDIRESKNEK